MIRRRRRLGLTLVNIDYESADTIYSEIARGEFSRMEITAYEALSLPPSFTLTRSELTVRIHVRGVSDDQLLSQFRKTYRNEIRRADESGLRFAMHDGGLDTNLYDMYARFEKKQGRHSCPCSFFQELIAFVAYEGDKAVSAIVCQRADPVLKVFAIFSARHEEDGDESRIGWASKRLVYDMCRFARKESFEFVDLAYIDTERKDRAGITSFKQGFGGETIRVFQYEYVAFPITLIRRVRRMIRI